MASRIDRSTEADSTMEQPAATCIDPAPLNSDQSNGIVELAAEPVDEYIDPVSLDGYSFDQLIEYIVSARGQSTESLISIRYPASKAYDLAERLERKLDQLHQSKIRRCEYDFNTGILYLDIMPERPMHYVIQEDFKADLKSGISAFLPTIEDATIRRRMSDVRQLGSCDVLRPGTIWKQGDLSFCEIGSIRLPSVIGEIS